MSVWLCLCATVAVAVAVLVSLFVWLSHCLPRCLGRVVTSSPYPWVPPSYRQNIGIGHYSQLEGQLEDTQKALEEANARAEAAQAAAQEAQAQHTALQERVAQLEASLAEETAARSDAEGRVVALESALKASVASSLEGAVASVADVAADVRTQVATFLESKAEASGTLQREVAAAAAGVKAVLPALDRHAKAITAAVDGVGRRVASGNDRVVEVQGVAIATREAASQVIQTLDEVDKRVSRNHVEVLERTRAAADAAADVVRQLQTSSEQHVMASRQAAQQAAEQCGNSVARAATEGIEDSVGELSLRLDDVAAMVASLQSQVGRAPPSTPAGAKAAAAAGQPQAVTPVRAAPPSSPRLNERQLAKHVAAETARAVLEQLRKEPAAVAQCAACAGSGAGNGVANSSDAPEARAKSGAGDVAQRRALKQVQQILSEAGYRPR